MNKNESTITTPTPDPADSFVGTWNTIDSSYYYTVYTDARNFNFNIIKTAANKVSIIGFPNSSDTTLGTVTTSSMVTDDSTLVIQVVNPRVMTYKLTPGPFPPLDYFLIGKATKL
jgi:hypothetical protein